MPPTKVSAFVDWNSQIVLTGVDPDDNRELAARAAFNEAAKRITTCLTKIAPTTNFRVTLRLYHGWHKGYEPAPSLRAIRTVIARTDFAALSRRPTVVFSPIVGFGDRLLCALPRRLHARLDIHLPNTYRVRRDVEREEKMVDTALAVDVVAAAHQDPQEWIMILAEDDDLIPPAFAAEAILSASSATAILLRRRTKRDMLLLEDLLING